jgi:two-component system chemotaxis response regulator CheY
MASTGASHSSKVLVTEDSSTIRLFLKRVIQEILPGIEIEEASDGAEALRKLEGGGFSLMITDLNMPVMNGADLLSHAREEGLLERCAVLVLSSDLKHLERERFQDLPHILFLRKPALASEISSAIHFLRANSVVAGRF